MLRLRLFGYRFTVKTKTKKGKIPLPVRFSINYNIVQNVINIGYIFVKKSGLFLGSSCAASKLRTVHWKDKGCWFFLYIFGGKQVWYGADRSVFSNFLYPVYLFGVFVKKVASPPEKGKKWQIFVFLSKVTVLWCGSSVSRPGSPRDPHARREKVV